MVNRHKAFWSNMSDGSADFGYTDESFARHMKEQEERKEDIYNMTNQIMKKYNVHQTQTVNEICEAVRKIIKEWDINW